MTAPPARGKAGAKKPRPGYHHGDLAATLVREGLAAVEAAGAPAGIAALTLRGLARRARVSPAAVYRHFADKEALLAAIAVQGFARLNARFAAALTEARRRTPLARLRALGMAYIDFALAHPGLCHLMFGAGRPAMGRYAALEDEAARAWRYLADAVAAAGAPGANRRTLDAATVAAWSLVHGYAVLRLEGQLAGFAPSDLPDAEAILLNLVPGTESGTARADRKS